MKLFKNAKEELFCTLWFEVSFMFAPLLRLIGVDQITIPKYCMSNCVLITYNKAHFNASLLQFFFFFTKITYNTFPFSMERSSCPIMCISSVDWSFCKTQRWTILQSHEHRGHNRLLYAWQKLLLSDETIGLRPLHRGQLVFCEGVKWLFCAWDERSGSVVLEWRHWLMDWRLLRGPWVKQQLWRPTPPWQNNVTFTVSSEWILFMYFSCR